MTKKKVSARSKRARATKVAKPVEKTCSKKDTVIALLRREGGATIRDVMNATGWQAHYADVRIMPTCAGNPACGAGIAAMESA